MSPQSRTQPVPDRVADKDASLPDVGRDPDTSSQLKQGAPETVRDRERTAAVGGGLLLAGVALAAANMRPAVTSLASVLGEVRGSLEASSTWASVVTSVPTLCFGAAGISAPRLARDGKLGTAPLAHS